MSDKYAAGAAMGLAVRLTDLGLERFGVCQAAPCSGVFIDISASRTRRYCSDRCASRANVIAYRARKRERGSGTVNRRTAAQLTFTSASRRRLVNCFTSTSHYMLPGPLRR